MADNLTQKQFLDFAGLAKFWELIKGKFATKADAVGSISVTQTAADKVTIIATAVDGQSQKSTFDIASATDSVAGLMSAKDKADLDSLKLNSNFKGIALQNGDNTAVDIASEKKAVLKLSYDSANKKIKLADANGTAYSEIDATDFVKDAFLKDVQMGTGADGTKLIFTFNKADNTTETIPVDLSKFVDTYTAGNGLTLNDRAFTIVLDNTVADKPHYLEVSSNGLRVADALWTKVGELDKAVADAAATDAQNKADAALAAAKGYTDAQIGGPLDEGVTVLSKIGAAETKAATDLATAVGNYSVKGEDGSVTTPASGLKGEIEAAEARAAADATTKANAAEDNARDYVDQEIAKVVGDGGTLAGTLQAAKDYTDVEIAKVNAVIGKAAEGEGETATAATGLYKYIDDADAKVLKDAKDYADGLASNYDKAGSAAEVKDYANETFVKLEGYVAYSAEEQTKLAGIEDKAEVNVIEAVKVNGVTATITDKTAEVTVDCYTQKDVDDKLAAINTKIGTVPAGKDVVTMISDAETSAKGYAKSLYDNIVAISLADIEIDKLEA
jgi:hypothetical protein